MLLAPEPTLPLPGCTEALSIRHAQVQHSGLNTFQALSNPVLTTSLWGRHHMSPGGLKRPERFKVGEPNLESLGDPRSMRATTVMHCWNSTVNWNILHCWNARPGFRSSKARLWSSPQHLVLRSVNDSGTPAGVTLGWAALVPHLWWPLTCALRSFGKKHWWAESSEDRNIRDP